MANVREMVCLADFEKFAKETLPRSVLEYYRSGADEEISLADNMEAFKRYKIIPRVLRDVSHVDTSTTILGHRISFPVCISPTGFQGMAHPDREIATAKGALRVGTLFTLSTAATSSIEEIATEVPDVLRFFQLYILSDKGVAAQLVRRAEHCGFKALLLTVDTPYIGKRREDIRNKFTLPSHLRVTNFATVDFKDSNLDQESLVSGLQGYITSMLDATLTWEDIKWLKSITRLPIILKGILSKDDAVLAVNYGVSGILVSNHGARQLDTVPATIDVISEIVRAVDGKCEVYLDSGVRTGTDVLKALALGAKAVFIGRPAIYALAYNGEEGVEQMLQILKEEFYKAMAFTGCSSVHEILPTILRSSPVSDLQVSNSKL